MRFVTILFLIASIALFSGCSNSDRNATLSAHESVQGPTSATQVAKVIPSKGTLDFVPEQVAQTGQESLAKTQAQSQAIERKIIQNAELTIELDSPQESQRRIASIAVRHGGFVVTSETKQNTGRNQTSPQTTLTIIARVPAAKFDEAVKEIERLGGNLIHSKIAGQDVTEEYIDLEARIRTKRALESQFLEIMKRAGKISEALEVQKELAEVRSEIETMEGRHRFLENQSALSTITVTLQTPTPIVAATTGGFWHSIKLAFGEGFDTAAEIVIGVVRFIIVLIPITLLILLPGFFVLRWSLRRFEWPKKAQEVSVADQVE